MAQRSVSCFSFEKDSSDYNSTIVPSDPNYFGNRKIRVIQTALIKRCQATGGFAGESGVGRVSA